MAVAFQGCGQNDPRDLANKTLIRVGGSVATVQDFWDAFKDAVTIPVGRIRNSDALRDEKLEILGRLTDELIILERGRRLGLTVDDAELARAVNGFKRDYPGDTFTRTLAENGISYAAWEKALRRRLLVEKVIRAAFPGTTCTVPPEPYAKAAVGTDTSLPVRSAQKTEAPQGGHAQPVKAAPSQSTRPVEPTAASPTEQSEQKTATPFPTIAGTKYSAWITGLKKQYPIEIDWKLWEKVKSEPTDDL